VSFFDGLGAEHAIKRHKRNRERNDLVMM
jgi:hypothetical protein